MLTGCAEGLQVPRRFQVRSHRLTVHEIQQLHREDGNCSGNIEAVNYQDEKLNQDTPHD